MYKIHTIYIYLSVQCFFWFVWFLFFGFGVFLMQTILDIEVFTRMRRMILHTESVIILQAGCLFALPCCH